MATKQKTLTHKDLENLEETIKGLVIEFENTEGDVRYLLGIVKQCCNKLGIEMDYNNE